MTANALAIEPEDRYVRYSGERSTTYTSTPRKRKTRTGDELKNMYKQQLSDFNLYQQPIIAALEDEAQTNDLTLRAEDRASGLKDRVTGVTDRNLSMSSSTLLPSQRKAMERRIDLKTKLGEGSMVTAARDSDKSRRVAARHSLMGIAEQLQNTGVANMTDVATKEYTRKRAAKNANKSLMGQALGIAGTVAGGMIGGSMGASIGGSIGTTVGMGIGG